MGKRSAKRSCKDSLFRMVFREKKELLSLYNAINGTMYEDPEELVVTTIEDVLYMGRKNDISFLIKDVMNLYEHQSSVNPNMPLRGLIYICMLYQGYLEQNNLDIYSSTRLRLPTPKYLVFYNGTKEEPDRRELRLSDSFIKQEEPPDLECRAVMLNINYGHNKELMEACRKLYEYSRFVESIREHLNTGMKLGAAMDQAIEDCIRLDILKELLLKHRGEVKQVILTEYNEERHAKTLLEEGRRQGREESARLLQIEREENARLLQKEQEKSAQLLQKEREKNAQLLQKEQEKSAQLLQKEQEKSAQLQKERDQHIQSVRQLLLQVLKLKGLAAEPITRRILEEQDPKLLQLWISFAGDIDSAEELEKMILEKRQPIASREKVCPAGIPLRALARQPRRGMHCGDAL